MVGAEGVLRVSIETSGWKMLAAAPCSKGKGVDLGVCGPGMDGFQSGGRYRSNEGGRALYVSLMPPSDVLFSSEASGTQRQRITLRDLSFTDDTNGAETETFGSGSGSREALSANSTFSLGTRLQSTSSPLSPYATRRLESRIPHHIHRSAWVSDEGEGEGRAIDDISSNLLHPVSKVRAHMQ